MRITVPGDKSLTHRALLLGALADGESTLSGLLPADDTNATASALRALGAGIPELPADGGEIRVTGVGLRGMTPPPEAIDCGNSGTTARLLMGVLAAQDMEVTLTGDASLRKRPMGRVTDPLSRMGARFQWLDTEGVLPVRVRGTRLEGGEHRLSVASAQVKSALLLAGMASGVPVTVVEPGASRDHTERMLRTMGVQVTVDEAEGDTRSVRLHSPPSELSGFRYRVPGDFSSAAFLLALAVLGGRVGELRVEDVGLNPTRTGLLKILERMGAVVEAREVEGGEGGSELRGTLVAAPSALQGTGVEAPEVPGVVDEIPVVAILAARAAGGTRITGAQELRVKESDRIRALSSNLERVGVEVEELPDGLRIRGAEHPLQGRVEVHGDHRIAMAFAVLGALRGNDIQVDDPDVVAVSYPGFWRDLRRLTGDPSASSGVAEGGHAKDPTAEPGPATEGDHAEAPPGGLVVTVDGPAASGKSSTARAVARRLGLPHLDSGTFYRAVTHALLARGVPEDRWSEVAAAELEALGVEVSLDARRGVRVFLDGKEVTDELRRPEVTARVSHLAAIPSVRRWLLPRFRDAAGRTGAVADGRDLGTVVFPDADVKVYLTAALEERARRRLLEEGRPTEGEAVAAEARRLRERDRKDSERDVAPLRCPEDATVVDTTGLEFEEQVEAVVRRVRSLTAADDAR